VVFRIPEPGRQRRTVARTTVEETLQSIASSGAKTVLLQPIGFLCDHVEILYDVDIFFASLLKS